MDNTRIDRFAFEGGLNTETPPLVMPAGFATEAQNFECAINGGYRRIGGYERFDGQVSPSAQFYYTLPATGIGSWVLGDTITGITSGETATVLGETTAGFLIGKASGIFTDTEDLQISAASVGTCAGGQYVGGADSIQDDASFTNLAADLYRSDIAVPTGVGSILGVWVYNDTVYCFRNNAGSSAANMWKATSSGWTQISLGYELPFDADASNGTFAIGDTVTGLTSGANGVITGIAKRSGAFGADAIGVLTFASIAGGAFSSGEDLQVSAATQAQSTAVSSAIALAPDGRYQFHNYNFGGDTGTYNMYGCDGQNRAFEFDGTTFIPITTGMTDDTPNFITAHNNHLFLAFDASLQHSGIGDPMGWTPLLGAGELALGDTITGLSPQIGDVSSSAMLAVTRGRAYMLYGNSAADWNLVIVQHEAGGIAYTLNKIGFPYMLDDRGITRLGLSQDYGNFEQATVSRLLQTWVKDKKPKAVDSMIHKELNQYRLFFSDKFALYVTILNNKIIGMMPQLFNHAVACSVSAEMDDGSERAFFGATDGMVYEMEKGTSFDGAVIDASLVMAFNHVKSPNIRKRYRKVALELKGSSYVDLSFAYELGYGSTLIGQPTSEAIESNLTTTYWDGFIWDSFYWDGRTLAPTNLSINGTAQNISVILATASEISSPFTLTGLILHYTPRRRDR